MAITLSVNGASHTVDVDPDTPLLWVLRDHLGLTGTKFGCGTALCGACTVHVDGEAVRSCVMPVSSLGEGKVTTMEALGAERLHRLQRPHQPQLGRQQLRRVGDARQALGGPRGAAHE